jgi:hypothetical protein
MAGSYGWMVIKKIFKRRFTLHNSFLLIISQHLIQPFELAAKKKCYEKVINFSEKLSDRNSLNDN